MSATTRERPGLADELGGLLNRLTQLMRQAALPPGMSPAQARTLLTLRERGPQRVTALAELERLAQPTVSALVGQLERSGWVERRADGVDRRVVLVRLTPAGLDVIDRATAARSHWLDACLAHLPASQLAELEQALPALRRVLDAAERRD